MEFKGLDQWFVTKATCLLRPIFNNWKIIRMVNWQKKLRIQLSFILYGAINQILQINLQFLFYFINVILFVFQFLGNFITSCYQTLTLRLLSNLSFLKYYAIFIYKFLNGNQALRSSNQLYVYFIKPCLKNWLNFLFHSIVEIDQKSLILLHIKLKV